VFELDDEWKIFDFLLIKEMFLAVTFPSIHLTKVAAKNISLITKFY